MGCVLRSRSSAPCFSETERSESHLPPTPEFYWEREDGWHVIAKVLDDEETPRRKNYYTSDNNDDFFISPSKPPNTENRKRRCKKKKTRKSSVESFDDEETETLVSSSGSFTTDSSSAIRKGMTIRHRSRRKRNRKVKKARRSRMMRLSSSESESPARLSSFLKRIVPCTVEGKVSESFAVVKKSEDPCKDFKHSMIEMILENQMFENEDLEQLLLCFLSLNSRRHHGAIVQAFAEIWEALSSTGSNGSPVSFALNLIN